MKNILILNTQKYSFRLLPSAIITWIPGLKVSSELEDPIHHFKLSGILIFQLTTWIKYWALFSLFKILFVLIIKLISSSSTDSVLYAEGVPGTFWCCHLNPVIQLIKKINFPLYSVDNYYNISWFRLSLVTKLERNWFMYWVTAKYCW